MLKPFTKEGRFECGLDEIVKGKTWCFTAVVGKNYPARLGVAVANEAGYYPVPEHWCHGDDYQEMEDHADALNREEGLEPREAMRIVSSSMAEGGIRRESWVG